MMSEIRQAVRPAFVLAFAIILESALDVKFVDNPGQMCYNFTMSNYVLSRGAAE